MTTDQIKAMSDEQINDAIAQRNDYMFKPYSTDLSAACPLQWGKDIPCNEPAFDNATMETDPRRCARLISEAWLYLKTKGE